LVKGLFSGTKVEESNNSGSPIMPDVLPPGVVPKEATPPIDPVLANSFVVGYQVSLFQLFKTGGAKSRGAAASSQTNAEVALNAIDVESAFFTEANRLEITSPSDMSKFSPLVLKDLSVPILGKHGAGANNAFLAGYGAGPVANYVAARMGGQEVQLPSNWDTRLSILVKNAQDAGLPQEFIEAISKIKRDYNHTPASAKEHFEILKRGIGAVTGGG
jgi:hypothetical protein